jgi:glycolate oxidase
LATSTDAGAAARAETVLTALAVAVPRALVTDPLSLAGYAHDEAATVPHGSPLAVLLPRETSQVQEIVRLASRFGVAIVPRGAGSGLSGGANASDGCLVLSLERMDRLVQLDADNLLAVVEPGLINARLGEAARAVGLHYPPDPASYEFSTLGGNIATNAGGLCCVKYGVTRDSVLGLEVVLADGTLVRTGTATLKGVAGYDLTSLFVGSEGTLGIIVQATLRLRPMPPLPATLVAFFPSLDAAGTAAVAIRRHLVPSLLELMDREVISAVESWKHLELDTTAEAMLLAQSDGGGEAGTAEAETMARICQRGGASFAEVTADSLETQVFMSARKLALPALQRLGTALLDDVAVPTSRIVDLISAIHAVAADREVTIGTFGHAGDGNMHPTIVFDPADEASSRRAAMAFDDIVRAALDLGGTVTGEHGVGVLKRQHLLSELGPTSFRLQTSIKSLLDPQGILNPGKVF